MLFDLQVYPLDDTRKCMASRFFLNTQQSVDGTKKPWQAYYQLKGPLVKLGS